MKFVSLIKPAAVLLALFLLVSCGGKQTQTEQTAAPAVIKLDKKYDTLLFSAFTAKPIITKDYPQAAKELQHSAMTTLQMENTFKKIGKTSQDQPIDGNTLIIKVDITDLRIVGGTARFWGGAMAGSSGLEWDFELIDGATSKVIRKEKMNSWNNAFGAAWTGGSSDNSLLDDVGKIIAKYITDSMPTQ